MRARPPTRRSCAGERRRRGDAGAREAVVEAQHPDPSAVEDVVEGGVVRRIGRRLRSRRRIPIVVEPPDVLEVREEALGLRQIRERGRREPERPVQSAAGPGGVDHEARAQPQRPAGPGGVDVEAAVRHPRRRRSRSDRGTRRPRPPPRARGTGRSPAGTSACRRPRRSGSPPRGAGRSGPGARAKRLSRLVRRRT